MRDKTVKELHAKRAAERAEKAKKEEAKKAKQEAARAEKAKKQEVEKAKRAAERKHKKELNDKYLKITVRMAELQKDVMIYLNSLTFHLNRDALSDTELKKLEECKQKAHEYDKLRAQIGEEPVVAKAEATYQKYMQRVIDEEKKRQHEEKIAKLRDQGYDENMRPLRPEDCVTNPLEMENLNKPDMSLAYSILPDRYTGEEYCSAKPKRLVLIEKFLARVKKQEDIISKWNQDHLDDQIQYDHAPIEKAKAYWKQIRNLLSVSLKEHINEMDRWNSGDIPFADVSQFTYVKGYSPLPELIDLYDGDTAAANARLQKEMSRKYVNGSGMPKEPLDSMPEIENHWQVAPNIGVVTFHGGRQSVRDALAEEHVDLQDLGIDPSEINDDQEKIIKSAGESTLNKGENN